MKFLTNEFLSKYPNQPESMIGLASFVFYRTYSRWLESLGRRETYKEAVSRAVEYNVGLGYKKLIDNKFVLSEQQVGGIKSEAEALFDNIFNQKQFLSGRTHWVGGADTGVAEKFPMSNFNCAFVEIKKWVDIAEVFYLLMVGSGVGIRLTKANIKELPPVRLDYELSHSEFKPMPKSERLQHTKVNIMENGYAKIYVADSKEGWTDALKLFLEFVTNPIHNNIKHIKISYNSIRPAGERLKTFGGRASGYEPLKEMFRKMDMMFHNKLNDDMTYVDEKHARVRTIHLLDLLNLQGANVVVGGVRRTAEMIICDEDDIEVIEAKQSFWEDENKLHRAMSNNSIGYQKKPTREKLHQIIDEIRKNGEPGIVNLEAGARRRPNFNGVNPCGEILLDSKGVCNLTTVNIMGFVRENNGVMILDGGKLEHAMRLSVRAGLRMLCLTLELPEWDFVHHRDSLIGASITGWQDAMDKLNYPVEQQQMLLKFLSNVAYEESIMYCQILRIPTPLLITTVKPEGTLSQVANGVSSGLHVSHSEYYIRRIRISAHDPLAEVAKKLGWNVQPEYDTPGKNSKEKMANAKTLVIDFPIKSGSKKTRSNQTLKEQFDTYFMFQEFYTDHNSSITISVRDDEWEEVEQILWDRWDDIVGVSFLPYDDSIYPLAPYEAIDELTYKKLIKNMKPFDVNLLHEAEKQETERDVVNMQSCETGICPI